MQVVLAFDVYGTIIDTGGVSAALDAMLPGRGAAFAAAWRQKQLEYTFRRVAMRCYKDFRVCTRAALEYANESFEAKLSESDKDALLDYYRMLPSFSDVSGALSAISATGARVIAFSNGVAADVDQLLTLAGIRDRFEDIVSVDEVRSFKPDSAVYEYFMRRARAEADQCWLVSANPFDVIGARGCGMRAVWVNRGIAVFDPWEVEPSAVVRDLAEIPDVLAAHAAVI